MNAPLQYVVMVDGAGGPLAFTTPSATIDDAVATALRVVLVPRRCIAGVLEHVDEGERGEHLPRYVWHAYAPHGDGFQRVARTLTRHDAERELKRATLSR